MKPAFGIIFAGRRKLSARKQRIRGGEMKHRWLIAIIFIFLSCVLVVSCSSSESTEAPKKAAIIRITCNSTPILMEWDRRAQLWYMRPVMTVAETNGIGATITSASLEFIYQGQAGYERQEVAGGRLNANSSKTFYLECGTEYYGYEAVRFSIYGTDDNGHSVNQHRDINLHYVK